MIRYVTYDLNWAPPGSGIGHQPYQIIADNSASFDGGVFCKDGIYFGYVEGDIDATLIAISACTSSFNMIELSEADALAFYTTVYPKNTIIQNMPSESIKYTGAPYIGENGKMKFDLYDTEQP